MNTESVRDLIKRFEDCTLPKEEWTHVNHFIMAFWYCIQYPVPQAIEKIRMGIKRYNQSIGGANTDVSGYHETITLFYTATIARHLLIAQVHACTDESLVALLQQPFLTKDYIFRFYSRELLTSTNARLHWIAPDKTAIH